MLDLYDYANSFVSLLSPREFQMDSKYKRHYSNENYLNIVAFNIIDLFRENNIVSKTLFANLMKYTIEITWHNFKQYSVCEFTYQ